MSRLIDADELKKSVPETTTRVDCVLNCDLMGKEYVNMLIDQAPTVDLWKYPSRGEYPKHERNELSDDKTICMWIEKYVTKFQILRLGYWTGTVFVDTDMNELPGKVLAWQYIVPPKEEE